MHLTRHTDYALRLMMQLALFAPRRMTVEEVASAYGISKHHLMKVAQKLIENGYVRSVRGRTGGIELNCDVEAVSVGEIVRATEENLRLVECFGPTSNECPITPACRLKQTLSQALNAFLAELDKVTLADLVRRNQDLRTLLEPSSSGDRCHATPA